LCGSGNLQVSVWWYSLSTIHRSSRTPACLLANKFGRFACSCKDWVQWRMARVVSVVTRLSSPDSNISCISVWFGFYLHCLSKARK
jgi:hypothetical protein